MSKKPGVGKRVKHFCRCCSEHIRQLQIDCYHCGVENLCFWCDKRIEHKDLCFPFCSDACGDKRYGPHYRWV